MHHNTYLYQKSKETDRQTRTENEGTIMNQDIDKLIQTKTEKQASTFWTKPVIYWC